MSEAKSSPASASSPDQDTAGPVPAPEAPASATADTSNTKTNGNGNGNTAARQRENPFVSLVFNIAVPIITLQYADNLFGWPPAVVLCVALAFPVAYFFYDLAKRRNCNFISILGFVSVLLTGGIGLLQLSREWIAVKEAAVPLAIGLVLLLSSRSRKPLVKTLLYNEQVIDVQKVDARLAERGKRPDFNHLLVQCTILLSLSFLLSGILNYVLARIMVTTDPEVDPQLFNEQISAMMGWSWVVIVIPSMAITLFALYRLVSGLTRITGLELEELFHNMPKEEPQAENSGKG